MVRIPGFARKMSKLKRHTPTLTEVLLSHSALDIKIYKDGTK